MYWQYDNTLILKLIFSVLTEYFVNKEQFPDTLINKIIMYNNTLGTT